MRLASISLGPWMFNSKSTPESCSQWVTTKPSSPEPFSSPQISVVSTDDDLAWPLRSKITPHPGTVTEPALKSPFFLPSGRTSRYLSGDQVCLLGHFYITFVNIPGHILLQLWMWLPSMCNPWISRQYCHLWPHMHFPEKAIFQQQTVCGSDAHLYIHCIGHLYISQRTITILKHFEDISM